MTEQQKLRTKVNPKWLVKIGIFTAVLFGLGIWGWVDATMVYPARGRAYIDFALRDYLKRADESGALLSASVRDPAAEYLSLLSARESLNDLERAKLAWLEGLSRLHSLTSLAEQNRAEAQKRENDPAYQDNDTFTMFVDPRGRLVQLEQSLSTKRQPQPLAAYDLPMQYLIMFGGFAGTAWLLFLIARVARKRYMYEPAIQRLTVPGGRSFVPAEIIDVDKRKWHKFFVTFKVKDPNAAYTFDLLRYIPLEEWILEMERAWPGYVPEKSADEVNSPADSQNSSRAADGDAAA